MVIAGGIYGREITNGVKRIAKEAVIYASAHKSLLL
jgi:hypothetical protein